VKDQKKPVMTILGPRTRIAGRYELLDRLDAGALGELWRAYDVKLARQVALKLVRPELGSNPSFRDAFRDEARAWAAVCDPGSALVYDFGEEADPAGGPPAVYLVVELVEGRSLDRLLADTGPLSPMEVMDAVAQAASTLHAAHGRALVHGNVKSSNLILRADGVLKVTDFGLARAFGGVPLADAAVDLDSAAFRSPEQAAGGPATVASDIYSLGVVAHHCLAGELPFPADGPVAAAVEHLTEHPRPLPASVPDPVAALVRRMLSKDPAERPTHAGDLARSAVGICRRLGRRTTRPARDLLGWEGARLVG
jgi:serine/threonine protein kinase